jgi:tight adherence protein C
MPPFVLALLLFLLMATVITAVGIRLWVKPRQALERVEHKTVAAELAVEPRHPSLSFREVLEKLGSFVPASPKDVTIMQRRLYRAGFRGPHALRVFYGAKLILALSLPLLVGFLVAGSNLESTQKTMLVGAGLMAGFLGPNKFVQIASRRRQRAIQRGLANALDLMVVCVESGLGLDQAILQVSKDLEHAHPEISEEFALVNLELRAGKRRAEALRNLADRNGVDDLKKLVAVLIQADRFGTGIAQSLRGHADFMRVQARQAAEEKAAKLGVKLVFPIFFCILPTLFVVTVGPVIVRIIRELLPMMTNL